MSYILTPSKFLDETEVSEVLASLPRGRDGLMIELTMRCGARSQEIVNLTKADIDSKQRTVFIRGLKSSNDRYVRLPRSFMDRLMNYVKQVAGERIFPITTRRFRYIWDRYRPHHKGLHALRHTFAVNICQKTKNIHLVKQLLGHKNIRNTMIYLDYVNSDEVIDEAIQDLYGNAKRKTQKT